MQYQYTGMGQCKCPQGGNILLMDKKRLRHREREREWCLCNSTVAFVSRFFVFVLQCQGPAQRGSRSALMPDPTFGAPSCPQLLPIETGLLGNSEPKTHCKLQTLLRIVERWEASQGVIAGTWGCVGSRAHFCPLYFPDFTGWAYDRTLAPAEDKALWAEITVRIIRWIQDKRKEAANNEGANTKRKVKRLDMVWLLQRILLD